MKKTVLLLLLLLSIDAFAQQKIKVACVGNSITYGSGIANRELHSYPSQLSEMLGQNYLVENFGKPGATLLNKGHRPYTKQSEYTSSIEFAGDIVVIHLGVNDTDPRNWPNFKDEFVTDYLELIADYKIANPKAKIIISKLTPITHNHGRFNSGTKLWHTQIQEEIELVAKTAQVELIDLHKTLYPYPQLIPDALHPNELGAKLMAQTIFSAITGDYGGLKLSNIYSDNMVLQRNTPLDIRGTANAGEKVTVKINGAKATAYTNNQGDWVAVLPSMTAGGPYKLSVKAGAKTETFENVMVGEVWLCSGQSNMAWQLNWSNKDEQNIALDNTNIRLFDMRPKYSFTNPWDASTIDSINMLKYYKPTSWSLADKNTLAPFSAIAAHFGKMLEDSLNIPIGLICNAIGGASTESWIDRNSLETKFPLILNNWLNNDFIMDWVRTSAAKTLQNAPAANKRHPYEPAYLFDAGIMPLDKYPIKGVIWYQGESNAHNIDTHEKLFPIMIDSWRNYWNNPSLPFYYVQLSSLNRPTWTWFRNSQRLMMSQIENTAMAVSSDLGHPTDVHPTHKKAVGERLARLALNKSYNFDIVPSGPLVEKCEIRKNKIYVNFCHNKGLRAKDGAKITTFEIAKADKQFKIVDVTVENDTIVIECKDAAQIKYVRYGWQPYTLANLVNAEMLPASTFLYEL